MIIEVIDSIDSTQKELIRRAKNNSLESNICLMAKEQTDAIGSRNNHWDNVKEYLAFSFSYDNLPSDLPIQSVAIFYGYIFKEVVKKYNKNVWLKYPNDLYLDSSKVGGILVSIIKKHIICGIGLNLKSEKFSSLNMDIDKIELLNKFFEELKKQNSWKQIFSNYKLEFELNFPFKFHYKDDVISLKDSVLCIDGSLLINGKKIYEVRRTE